MLPKTLVLPRFAASLVSRRSFLTSLVYGSAHGDYQFDAETNNGREVVGYGQSGREDYADRLDYWYPAIRFRKDDDVILPIKHKELGDWKNLTAEEKKLLYRYSYRQTLAEFEAPTGYWKVVVTGIMLLFSTAMFYTVFLKSFVYPPHPVTLDPEVVEMGIEMELVVNKGQNYAPVRNFDYEKNRWK